MQCLPGLGDGGFHMPIASHDSASAPALVSGDTAPLRGFFTAIEVNLAMAGANAVNAQQQNAVTAQAALTQGIATLMSVDTASVGVATAGVLKKGSPKASA